MQISNENNGGNNKVETTYNANLEFLGQVFGKDAVYGKPDKLDGTQFKSIVDEITRARREARIVEVTAKVKATLDLAAEVNKKIEEEERKLEKLKKDNKEAFNKKFSELYKDFESIDDIRKDYAGLIEGIIITKEKTAE